MSTQQTTATLPKFVALHTWNNVSRPALEIEQYRPHPEKPGYLQSAGNISYESFAKAVRWFLERSGKSEDYANYAEGLDYCGLSGDLKRNEKAPLPKHHWIAVFAVTGGNEGHYIHIELIEQGGIENPQGSRNLIYLAKTFSGMAFAYEVCASLAEFLQA